MDTSGLGADRHQATFGDHGDLVELQVREGVKDGLQERLRANRPDDFGAVRVVAMVGMTTAQNQRPPTVAGSAAEWLAWARGSSAQLNAAHTDSEGKESPVHPTRIFADLTVPDLEEARDFYVDYLGLSDEQIKMDWVTRFVSPDGRVAVQLVTRDATAPENPAISAAVAADVEQAYAEAQLRRYEIVHPLTTEPWGIRRFFVRAPGGTVININSHRDG